MGNRGSQIRQIRGRVTGCDTLGRRLRTRRQPRGERIVLNERDYRWFLALHHHGPLPTSYLHAFTADTHRNLRSSTYRLGQLFHERNTEHGGPYLERPFQQFETLDPRRNELIHALFKHGRAALEETGALSKFAPAVTGPFKHQIMVSCITASIALQARTLGFRYIAQHELLERVQTELRIRVDGDLRPDAFFALEIAGKYIAFFVEADRGTEPLRTGSVRKSWQRTIRQYRSLLGDGLYREVFRLKAPAVLLNVTVSEKRLNTMAKMLQQEFPNGCPYILNHMLPEFGRVLRPPKLLDLLDIEWARAGHSAYRIA